MEPPRIYTERARGDYANLVDLSSSIHDFRLDFGQILGQVANSLEVRPMVSIFISPSLAKQLREMLTEQIDHYERSFGLITTAMPIRPSPSQGVN